MGHHAVYAGCQNGKNDDRQAGNILGKKSETDPKWLEGKEGRKSSFITALLEKLGRSGEEKGALRNEDRGQRHGGVVIIGYAEMFGPLSLTHSTPSCHCSSLKPLLLIEAGQSFSTRSIWLITATL